MVVEHAIPWTILGTTESAIGNSAVDVYSLMESKVNVTTWAFHWAQNVDKTGAKFSTLEMNLHLYHACTSLITEKLYHAYVLCAWRSADMEPNGQWGEISCQFQLPGGSMGPRPDMFCNFYLVKYHKKANNSTTKDREKYKHTLESLEYKKRCIIDLT